MSDLLDENNEIIASPQIESICNVMDRLRHLSIDGLLICVISIPIILNVNIGLLSPKNEIDTLFIIVVFSIVNFLYYFVLEGFFSKTIGKFFNKTRIVNIDGGRPTFKQVLIRTIIRIIPFSFFTQFTLYNRTLHDILSKTWTVRIAK